MVAFGMDKNSDPTPMDQNSAQFVIGKAIVKDITEAILDIFVKYKNTMDAGSLAGIIKLQADTIAERLIARDEKVG